MTASDRRLFRRRLLSWYSRSGRDLPWRRTRDPYAILVSELMLQQTQVASVLPYYSAWLRRFPDFATLATAPEQEVLHAWQGLGYYARARNLHAAAKAVVTQCDGELPRTRDEMRNLPGIGRYTANAVATFAFDRAVPIVEANTARCLSRIANLQVRIDSAEGQAKLWQYAADLLPRQSAGRYNSALTDLGALICVSGQPNCTACPVRTFCRAAEPAKLPLKKRRAATEKLVEHHRFALRADRVLLEQSQDRWRGMWILPRIATRPTAAPVYSAEFPFTNHRVTLEVFDDERLHSGQCLQRWFTLDELARVPLPSPHQRALTHLIGAHRQMLCSTLAAT